MILNLEFTAHEMRTFIERQKDEFDKSVSYAVDRDLSGRWRVRRYMHGQGWIPWLAPEGGILHNDHWLEHAFSIMFRDKLLSI